MGERDDVVREKPSVYGDQDAFGNDLAALRRNLRWTYQQRLEVAEKSSFELKELLRGAKRLR